MKRVKMQDPDCQMIDTANLLSRIAQLEQERDELRGNAEPHPALQNGFLGGLDFVSRLQGRRASGFEQELQQKLLACRKENAKLQEELSEVYLIKSKFAELLKMEVEKTAGLEKEVKFFQVQAATALSDRDRTLSEIERLHRKKDAMIEKITDLQNRLDHVTSEYTEEKSLCETIFLKLEKVKEENDSCRKLVEKFWTVRQQGMDTHNGEHFQERATILLQDPNNLWSYVEGLHDQARQESLGEKQVEDALSCCREQLGALTELALNELQQLKSCQRSLREDVCTLLLEEGKWMQEASEEMKRLEQLPILDVGNIGLVESDEADPPRSEVDGVGESHNVSVDSQLAAPTDDSNALAQALQEKVSALLLLSQQEERHILESNTTHVLESQISSLKQQLLQVTNEKMNALMELARTQERNRKLQEQEKTFKRFMQHNGAVEPEVSSSNDSPDFSSFASNNGKRALVQGYLKHLWTKGREYGGSSKRLGHLLSLRSKEEDGERSARLHVDNTSLQESIEGPSL